MPRCRSCGRTPLLLVSLAMVCSFSMSQAAAQTAPADQTPGAKSDFLFGRPNGALSVRGGWVFASAGSDIYDFVTTQLTIDRDDFNAPGFAVDVAFSVNPRIDIVGGFEFNKTEHASEYRDFVDNNFLPITQTTTLKSYNVGGSVRMSLLPRGYDVSRYVFVPRRVVPYVGAGGGWTYYNFFQSGDFVDFVDLSVFTDAFRSNGWTPSAHAFGGVDVQLYRALYGTVEGRYNWAAAELGSDFIDFDPIDLSGFRVSAGISLLF